MFLIIFLTGCHSPLNPPSLSPSPETSSPVVEITEPSKAGVSITASPTTVSSGQTITVTFSGAPGNQKDFIAMYKVGVANGQPYVSYKYLYGQKSGTLTFVAPQTPGDYEFRMFQNNTWVYLGKSNTVTVTSVSITASPTTVSSGQTITVTFSGAPGNQKDFIAMYKVGVANGQPYVSYKYLNGQKSGTLTFVAPQTPGDYEFRMFQNNTWVYLGKSNTVTVSFSAANPSFGTDSYEEFHYNPFGVCTYHYSGVGVINKGETGKVFVSVRWAYQSTSDNFIVFDMDKEEHVIVWFNTHCHSYGNLVWNTRPALPNDYSQGDVYVERL